MRIQHNIPAMSAYRNYTNNTSAVAKNLEKLSSGYKINRAGDDAAGLAISEKMRAQISGLEQAQNNAKSGINLIQTAEGALTEVHDMLNRMVTLAEQSANGTYDNDVDRVQLQKEVNQLRSEINRIAESANFNGIKLLDGSLDGSVDLTKWTSGSDMIAAAVENVSAAEVGDGTIIHDKLAQVAPTEFTVDFNNSMTTSTQGNITLTVGGLELSVDKTTITGTGENGEITAEDITAAFEAKYGEDGEEKDAVEFAGEDGSMQKFNLKADGSKLVFTQAATPQTAGQQVDGRLQVSVKGLTETNAAEEAEAPDAPAAMMARDAVSPTTTTPTESTAQPSKIEGSGEMYYFKPASTKSGGGAAATGLDTFSFTFADDVTDADKAALNSALAADGKLFDITFSAVTGGALANSNTVTFDNINSNYTLKFADDKDGTETAITAGGGNAVTVGDKSTAGQLPAGTSVTVYVYDTAGKKVGTLAMSGTTLVASQTDDIKMDTAKLTAKEGEALKAALEAGGKTPGNGDEIKVAYDSSTTTWKISAGNVEISAGVAASVTNGVLSLKDADGKELLSVSSSNTAAAISDFQAYFGTAASVGMKYVAAVAEGGAGTDSSNAATGAVFGAKAELQGTAANAQTAGGNATVDFSGLDQAAIIDFMRENGIIGTANDSISLKYDPDTANSGANPKWQLMVGGVELGTAVAASGDAALSQTSTAIALDFGDGIGTVTVTTGASAPSAGDVAEVKSGLTVKTPADAANGGTVDFSGLKGYEAALTTAATEAGAKDGEITIGYNETDKKFELKVGDTVIGTSQEVTSFTASTAETLTFKAADGKTDLGSVSLTPASATITAASFADPPKSGIKVTVPAEELDPTPTDPNGSGLNTEGAKDIVLQEGTAPTIASGNTTGASTKNSLPSNLTDLTAPTGVNEDKKITNESLLAALKEANSDQGGAPTISYDQDAGKIVLKVGTDTIGTADWDGTSDLRAGDLLTFTTASGETIGAVQVSASGAVAADDIKDPATAWSVTVGDVSIQDGTKDIKTSVELSAKVTEALEEGGAPKDGEKIMVQFDGTNWQIKAGDKTVTAANATYDAAKKTLTLTDADGNTLAKMTATDTIFDTDGTTDITEKKFQDVFKVAQDTGITYQAKTEDVVSGKKDYNASTEVITNGVAAGSSRLASTYISNDKLSDLKDGSILKVGDTTYTFAVGKDSKVDKSAEGTVVIDMTAWTGKEEGFLEEAFRQLTVDGKDNEMFSIGYDNGRLTFTEKEGYEWGEGVDLSTVEGIAEQFSWCAEGPKSGSGLALQIGDTAESFNQLNVDIKACDAKSIGIGDIDISTQAGASAAMEKIKAAINYVSDVRGDLGATQNRLDHTINNLSVMQENIQDAESTIRDVDVAKEMMEYTKNNILVQSAQAMLAQANQLPQGVLQLLG